MTNFDLHERAQQLADTASAYELARRLVEAEQDRDQLRGCFHSACEELTALKAALVDEGDEVPTGPALSLVEELKADRDALQRLASGRAEQRDALAAHVERLNAKLGEIQDALYGHGLQVAGWHLNGDNEPLDNWFEEHDWEPEDTPETSLARRDRLKQAEAFELAERHAKCKLDAVMLRANAADLRRQAEEDVSS